MNEKTKFENAMEAALNLPEAASSIVPKEENQINIDPNIENDFNLARTNLHSIISKGEHALDELLHLAKASEHPRAFEVVGQLIKTLTDANKDLLELQKKRKDLQKSDDRKSEAKNVTNAVFVGSTSELQALINKRNE
jgi:hypothetical protein